MSVLGLNQIQTNNSTNCAHVRCHGKIGNLLMLTVGHATQWKKILLTVAKDSKNLLMVSTISMSP